MSVQLAASLVIFCIGYFGMLAIKIIGFSKNNKKLGKMVYAAPKGLGNTDFKWQVLYFVLVIAAILIIDILGFLNATIFFYCMGLIGVYFGFATYSIFMCILGGRGLYQYGVRSMTGALVYEKIDSYEILQRKQHKGLSLKVKSKSGMLNATQIMFLDYEDKDDVDKILRVNVGVKGKPANYYGVRPNKKKRGKRRK